MMQSKGVLFVAHMGKQIDDLLDGAMAMVVETMEIVPT